MPTQKTHPHATKRQDGSELVCLCVCERDGVLADRCTRSQRWSMVAMETVWAEGAVSILNMQKKGPLRYASGFKMAVRGRSTTLSFAVITAQDIGYWGKIISSFYLGFCRAL